jgi:hypothetical protein
VSLTIGLGIVQIGQVDDSTVGAWSFVFWDELVEVIAIIETVVIGVGVVWKTNVWFSSVSLIFLAFYNKVSPQTTTCKGEVWGEVKGGLLHLSLWCCHSIRAAFALRWYSTTRGISGSGCSRSNSKRSNKSFGYLVSFIPNLRANLMPSPFSDVA